MRKAQTNTVTLTAASTYTGTTEIQAGALSINSITNVGGGASALGAPATVEDGIIRMGFTTAATTLSYTGSGHTSDRIIAMQGTTGGVTVDADGTGALVMGGVHGEVAGAKTLTLQGSSAVGIVNSMGLIEDCAATISVTKSEANTWSLTGANTYSGTTSVSAGTLLANNTAGSATGTGAVTVSAGATLGGNGSLAPAAGNNITVDGILSIGAPGRSTGEDLSISLLGSSALALNGTVKFSIFANTTGGSLDPVTSNDLLDINAPSYSNIVFGTGSILEVTTGLDVSTWQVNDAWQLIDWTGIGGTPPTAGFVTLNLPDLDTAGTTRSWDTSQLYTTGVISITGVPEPGRAMLLLLGLLALAARRRRAC